MRRWSLLCLSLLFVAPAWASDGVEVPVYRQVAGEILRLQVKPGDTLAALAAQAGTSWETLAALNGISNPDRIYAGQVLGVDTRRIVPNVIDRGLVVNVPEATLYVLEADTLTARYPVGLGQAAWPTPLGSFTVLAKEEAPDRRPPPTLREELGREARVVMKKGTPTPENSLGPYWIQLSLWGYGAYGTPHGSSVGRFLGRGCIRVAESAMPDLYRRVAKGTRVEVIYRPVKIAITPSGEVWAEAHPDPYGLGRPGPDEVRAVLQREGVLGRVDSKALDEVLRATLGVARRIAGPSPEGRAPEPAASPEDQGAEANVGIWRCLDCPPGPNRRVTFQVEALVPLELPNAFPLEIQDDAGRVVYRPQMVAQAIVHLQPGDTRNFVWEVRDTEGQPLAPGSYTAIIRVLSGVSREPKTLSLPLWIGG